MTNAHSNLKCSLIHECLIGCAAGATDAVQHWDKRLDHPKAVYVLTWISGKTYKPTALCHKNCGSTRSSVSRRIMRRNGHTHQREDCYNHELHIKFPIASLSANFIVRIRLMGHPANYFRRNLLMKRFAKTTSTVALMVSLAACGANPFVPPKANPIIIDRTPDEGDYTQTVATTAERRLVLVRQVGTDEQLRLNAANIHVNEGFCAEPSPDAIEAIAATFELSGSNSAAGSSQEAQLGQALASSAALATKRTQGLQFYRDTIFGLCQARMNGFMSNRELTTQLRFAREAAERMVLAEINSNGFSTPPTINVTVAAPELSSSEANEPSQ